MNKYSVNGFTRISKAAARKLYNAGQIVYFCACNMRPGCDWHPEIAVQQTGEPFENRVNNFQWYNCINSETGKYTAFYIRGV